MSDVNDLITEAGVYVDALVGGESANWIRLVELTDKLADALSVEHAEVERLTGEVVELEEALDEYQALHDANIVRFDALSARAKRAEAERDRFHDTIEVLDADYARLTAQLQAVCAWRAAMRADGDIVTRDDMIDLDAILDAGSGRRRVMTEHAMTLRLDEATHERLRREAFERRVSMNSLVRGRHSGVRARP